MLINRIGRRRHGSPTVERPSLTMHHGAPAAGLLLHAAGADVEIRVTELAEADDLVDAAVAMRAQLQVALDANAGGR